MGPVYEDLDSLKHDVKSVMKNLDEHTDKIDALTAHVKQVQDELGAIKDDVKTIREHQSEDINEVGKHIGLPSLTRN